MSKFITQSSYYTCLLNQLQKNWFEAYEDCRIKGMALAFIESDEEYGNLTDQITALSKISKLPVNRHEKLIFKKACRSNSLYCI